MKIVITESQYNKIVKASDVNTDLKGVMSVADGRRDLTFFTVKNNNQQVIDLINQLIKKANLKLIYVNGNENDAYVTYREGSESEALELKGIAEKYGGYLSYKATDEDTTRIGQLLGYHSDDIENHIRDKHEREKLENNLD